MPGLIHMDWGPAGALAAGQAGGIAVIVDVLSFSTTVTVAIDAGAEVFPYPFKDDSARDFARRHDATLAIGRFEARSGGPGAAVSLSPASMLTAPPPARIVLPSPNGSAIARLLTGRGARVVAASLRNRRAAARWIAGALDGNGRGQVIVVAAGERWPDDSLRPAVEDLWGAGAVIAALAELRVAGLTAEARTAAAAFESVAARLPAELADCVSGRELTENGFAADVAIAADLDASTGVPVLSGERFVPAND
jgi:2-phosphosulfolactate phosphatase